MPLILNIFKYVYKKNNLQQGGKIKDDFRVSPEVGYSEKFG